MNKPAIVHEDESLMVFNKPSGWIVNETPTSGDTPVLQTWIKKNLSFRISKSEKYRSGVVHRLDKETSGVLLIAKTVDAFKNLQKQFKKREIKKTYLTLVHGKIDVKKGEVNVPVGRLPWNRELFGVLPGGRDSFSKYEVESYYLKDDEEFSLVKVYPKTGRTHQIRIHMKYLGYPVVSDEFYAGRKTSRRDRKWCPRLFLHALAIEFIHPSKDKAVTYRAELGKDLKQYLDSLEEV